MIIRLLVGLGLAAASTSCAARRTPTEVSPPRIIPHSEWQVHPPLGHAAEATRRNLRPGESLTFGTLTITVVQTRIDSSVTGTPSDIVQLELANAGSRETRSVREGDAFNWRDYHLAVVAIYGPGELGAGLVAVEIGALSLLPPVVASSPVAGGAALRLRIPHRITHVTLHHTGSPEPLRRDEDPRQKLQGLQSWGARERNWWDVPYHFLIDLEGRIYEGRDWRYMGETNTTYNPSGHFLISVIGNYGRQEATPQQVEAIAALMAWALSQFNLPMERIGGHYNYAETTCPGEHLRKYLEDGTLQRMVRARLSER